MQFWRIHTGCGVVGGAVPYARVPGPAERFPMNAFSTVRRSAAGAVIWRSPSAGTWHEVQLVTHGWLISAGRLPAMTRFPSFPWQDRQEALLSVSPRAFGLLPLQLEALLLSGLILVSHMMAWEFMTVPTEKH